MGKYSQALKNCVAESKDKGRRERKRFMFDNYKGYEIKQIESWANGVGYEVAHWNSALSIKKRSESILERIQKNSNIVLEGCNIESLIKFNNNEKPIVLDVGCGMSYKTGTAINGNETDFRYIDPLAEFYNDILDKKNLPFPRISFGMVEYLSSFVEKNSVSFIMINNALDHSFDPVKGIMECMSVLKTEGILYLYHYKNEAERENYRGFHQFNIDCENGDLICWNNEKNTNISKMLSEYAKVEVVDLGDYVATVINKKKDLNINDFYSMEEDNKRLCIQIMYLISSLLNKNKATAFYRNYFNSKIFHWITSKVPYDFKQKIKKSLNKKRSVPSGE